MHIFAAELKCAIWYEWVPSKANASDGLSRLCHSKWVDTAKKLIYPEWLLHPMSVKTLERLIALD